MTENEIKLLSYLISHFRAGKINANDPRTHLPYSQVHAELGLPHDGRTLGDSLNVHAMGGLAKWLFDNRLPAITGVIINKLDSPEPERRGMPSPPYFTFHDREDLDYIWQRDQIRRACEINWGAELERCGITLADIFPLPEEIPDTVIEGARKSITVNAYERSSAARDACIKAHGVKCSVCNFDFERVYGGRGKSFIHVHHLIPLSEIGGEYELNPVTDLRPVCPNCHAMLHRGGNISIDELKSEIDFVNALRR
ncbi:HNH endonuclease [Pseudomonas cyclaminis]|uniref:HNH endonuclease n=1 Tax=Pseudomonas cyclaminis TaxID=2781239 RepID=UPI00382F0DC2